MAVCNIVHAGHAVIFALQSLGGRFILKLETFDEAAMCEEDGNYMMDVYVPPPGVASEMVFRGNLHDPCGQERYKSQPSH